ncbi:mechanosensitive ion channel [Sulfitobacter maritimus]|uniref:mechanosensitive ion channel family protein n=1 Tax=Sulfitobacter maritimus TaxID=2741719 RepID=UPI0031B642CC
MEPIKIMWRQVANMARDAIAMLPQIGVAIVILILTWALAAGGRALVQRGLSRTRLRQSLQDLFILLTSIAIWVFGIMIAAVIVFPGLTPASILAGLGIGSVAIGFAFKDVFENFLAGIIILFRREMRMSDYIECEGIEGKVAHIAIRESHIRQTDGQLVIVPNAMLFKNPVYVRTDQKHRRVSIICGVAYDVDVDEARRVITAAVKDCQTVEQSDHPIQVFAQEFADSSVNFEVTWWTKSAPVDLRRSKDEVISAVKQALDDAGLEIPFPYRTLTFKEPLPLQRAVKDEENG